MLIPRYNNFKVDMPVQIVPNWIVDMFTEILRDAELLQLYPNGPRECIAESLVGIDLPGMHMKLVEQNVSDMNKASYVTRYWPRGLNNIRVLDDNEIALTFRHIDGFYNYYMLRTAVDYMSDDQAQGLHGEEYKSIGDIILRTRMTDNWEVVDTYQYCVFSAIDGNKFEYAAMASEQTFTVRIKYTYYTSDFYYRGKLVNRVSFNHGQGN